MNMPHNMLAKSMLNIGKPYFKHKTYQLPQSQDDKRVNIDAHKFEEDSIIIICNRDTQTIPSRECFVILVAPNRSISNPPKKKISVILSSQHSKTEGYSNKFNNPNKKALSKSLFEPFVYATGTNDFLFLMQNKADCLVSEISIQNDYFIGEVKFMPIYVDSPEFLYKYRLFECFKPLCIGISENKIKLKSEVHYDLKVKPFHDNGSNQPFWKLDIYGFYISARNYSCLSQSAIISKLQVTQECNPKTDKDTQTMHQKNEDHKIKDMRQTNVIQIARGKNDGLLSKLSQVDVKLTDSIEIQKGQINSSSSKEAAIQVIDSKEARDPLKELKNRLTDRNSSFISPKEGINMSTNKVESQDPHIPPYKNVNKNENKTPSKNEANPDENQTAPQGPSRIARPSENFRQTMQKRQKRISDLELPGYSQRARGLIGFININLNCYMNSTLQCLLQAPLFSIYFTDKNHLREEFDSRNLQLAPNFAEILRITAGYDKIPSIQQKYPRDLHAQLSVLKEILRKRNPDFIDHKQNDAQEFLMVLLEGMSEELNRVITKPPYKVLQSYYSNSKDTLQDKSDEWLEYTLSRENSVITDLFGGQLLNKTICRDCKIVKGSFDNFWTLSLALKRGRYHDYTLQETLEDFSRKEQLINESFCAKCNKDTNATSQSIIWRLPELLVFDFKRFGRDQDSKIKYPVSNLDMSQFVKESGLGLFNKLYTYSFLEDSSTKDSKYTLFGVVTHEGTLKSGHYIADCQNLYDKKWYRFHDDYVSESCIKAEQTEICNDPSLLFYVRTSRVTSKSQKLFSRLLLSRS